MFGFGNEEENKVADELSVVEVFRNELKDSLKDISEEYQKNLQAKDAQIEEYKRIIAYYEEAFLSIRKVLVNQEKITDKSLDLIKSFAKVPGIRGGDGDAE